MRTSGPFGSLGHRELGKDGELDSEDLKTLHVSGKIQLASTEFERLIAKQDEYARTLLAIMALLYK